jgi:hypothetical protein
MEMEIMGRATKTSRLKKFGKKALGFYPPVAAYRYAKKHVSFRGETLGASDPTWNEVLLGAAKKKKKILPGVAKAMRAIGKVTSPITTAAAKAFLPASLVDAAAKLDPTKKGRVTPKAVAALQSLATTAQAEKAAELEKALKSTSPEKDAFIKTITNPKVIGIVAGGALILFIMAKKRR